MAPTSQKAGLRPISFLLSDGRTGTLTSVALNIRPEDLTRAEPSRITTHQTMGGAWADNFGPGLQTISISGHTGWKGGFSGDGVTQFQKLHDTVFTQWHAKRQDAVKAGQDPDTVQLIYADALDGITAVVTPNQFVLRRNKTRPLLMMYQIGMTVIQDGVTVPTVSTTPLSGDDLITEGLNSLQRSIDELSTAATDLRGQIDDNIITPVRGFMDKANTVMTRVVSEVNQTKGIVTSQVSQLTSFASDLAQCGRNVFYTINSISTLGDFAQFEVSRVASAYDNAFCVLSNCIKKSSPYPDYSGLYGASNCSSTAGGSPLSEFYDVNTFDAIMPLRTPQISVSTAARDSLNALMRTDPVLVPMTQSQLLANVSNVNAGANLLS